jgi:hypothetical protein
LPRGASCCSPNIACIRALNDELRKNFSQGHAVMTPSIRRISYASVMWTERTSWVLAALLAVMILASMVFWEKTQITSILSELTGEHV